MAANTDTGIYEIVNLVSGKRYVGSAVCLSRRKNQHWARLSRGRHHNRHLQASWNKHGPSTFVFRVLLLCPAGCLLLYEQLALIALRPEYNLSPTAGSTFGIVLSTETRTKISATALGRVRTPDSIERGAAKLRGRKLPPERVQHLIGNSHAVGYKHTDEWKVANSARMTGLPCPKSAKHRAKLSAALKGIPHSAERRAKQAAAQVGRKYSKLRQMRPRSPEETARIGAVISARQLGKPRKPETIEKMRAAAAGRTHSNEHKKRISEAAKAMWAVSREKMVAAQRKGRRARGPQKRGSLSSERKKQISDASKAMWASRKAEILEARASTRSERRQLSFLF